MDHFFFFGSCFLIGVTSGFLGGLLGIGGGVVIVPALLVLFDLAGLFDAGTATPVAVGTSLGCIIFTSLAAAITQLRAGMVEWRVVRQWSGFLLLGSFAAGFVAPLLPPAVFRGLIGGFLGFVAFVMLTNWKPNPHRVMPGRVIGAGLGSVGGFVSGLAGIGGGNVVVPTLVYFNVPMHRATATASTLGVPIAVAGATGYVLAGIEHAAGQLTWMLGYLYLPALTLIVAATVFAAPLGVRAAHRLSPMPLRRAFGALLVVVSLRMLWSAVS